MKAGWIRDVQNVAGHPRIGGANVVEKLFAASRDNDFVAKLVKSLGQSPPDSRSSPRDEDRVTAHVHGPSPYVEI